MKALTNVSEINVSYHPVKDWDKQPHIITSLDAYVILKDYFPTDTIHLQERFVVLYLNQNNRIIAAYRMSTGGIKGTVADIRLILGTALKLAATGIVIAHNHPSGSLTPSRHDIELTRKVYDSSKLMDIRLVDHLIITPLKREYYSFADEGEI